MKRWVQVDDDVKPEPYVHQEYPQLVHVKSGDPILVHSKEERDALKVAWGASPGGPFDKVPMAVPKAAE